MLATWGSLSTAAEPVIRLGVDVLADAEFEAIRGQRVGLVAHPASVAGDLTHSVDVLRAGADAGHFTFVAMFGPEHGVYGDIYAGDKV
ncbi:MAG: exo-beta-N-acetylmuramidase NamZ domain-containing protein, partial [Planctomycetota bacterium]